MDITFTPVMGHASSQYVFVSLIILVKVVHPGRGLFRQSLDVLEQLGVLLMDEVGEVATIVEDHVERLTVLKPVDRLLNAPTI